MLIPLPVVIGIFVIAGIPGAVVAAWKAHAKQRGLLGFILGWFVGVIGAIVALELVAAVDNAILPHREVRDVFGSFRVPDYPSEEVLGFVRLGGALLGSLLPGWLVGKYLSRG